MTNLQNAVELTISDIRIILRRIVGQVVIRTQQEDASPSFIAGTIASYGRSIAA